MAQMQFTKYNIATIGASIVVMFVLVFTVLLIASNNQPQTISTNAQTVGTPSQNAPMIPAVMHTLPCQFYLLSGGTFSQGDSLYCINIVKTLLDGVHAYDIKNQAGWWPTDWDEPFNDPGFGQRATNAVKQFQSTTQTTAIIRAIPWTWPVKNLDQTGIVNLDTYKDLCTQAVAVGVAGADIDCSIIVPTPTPTCTPKPAITCPVNGPCPTLTPPPGGWCPNPTPTCTPRPVCKPGQCTIPVPPPGGWCPETMNTPTPAPMHCGGNIANPPTCPAGYACVLNSIPDTGGTCEKIQPTCTPKPAITCVAGKPCPNLTPPPGGWCGIQN